ncbi:restriction endonuclease subunit S [Shewanella sp. A32]|uniref:restriction endonuclease subunit S n=1 Tax=Shewanella sp. A32 TaxID=3031327 RepID=UPI0023BA3016|nr:restriction endonuclease subunit S [Shewanella sp. A32]MDF0535630.1 restriction endonuclease subunit S [Shewanella sp. A32]
MSNKYLAYPEYKESGVEWLGQVPTDWTITKTTRFFKIAMGQTILREELVDDGLWPVYSATEGNHFFGYINGPQVRLDVGDLVIPARGNSIGAVKLVDQKATTTQTTIYCKHITNRLVAKYAFYYMLGNRKNLFRFTQTAIPQITVEEVGTNSILLPSEVEQRTIAAFLDYETARIDCLIEKQQRLIELLKEKRQAVISHAVTKGLNPDAPMKDSGVEWLGQVPEHWKVQKLGYLCQVTKLTGFEYTNHWSTDDLGDVVALRGYNIGERKLELEKGTERISKELSNRLARSKLNAGDLVLPCTGTLGNAAVIPSNDTFHINQNIAKLTFDATVLPEYASYWLTSSNFRTMVDHNNTSGMQPVLLIGDIRNMRIPIPPVEEQHTLVECLTKEMMNFESVESKAQYSLTLLQERRIALISAAVTGKIDVRGWVKPAEATASDAA